MQSSADSPAIVEDLIQFNNALTIPDAANGVLRAAQNAQRIQLQERWFEKLERWQEALDVYESRLEKTPSDTEALLAASAAAGKTNQIDIWVELVANLGPSVTGRSGTAGTYTVNFYKADPGRRKGSGNTLEYTNTTSGIKVDYATIPADKTFTSFSTSLPETEQGFYATVYAGQTLKGKWQITKLRNEAEEIEE